MLNLGSLCTAFQGGVSVAQGTLRDVALSLKAGMDSSDGLNPSHPVLVFLDATGEVVELDWRGGQRQFEEWLARAFPGECTTPEPEPAGVNARGPGRPRLGVVAREVTLLPRHWDWLARQPGGASVALRKLVEVARRGSEIKDRVREATAAGYRFMVTIAGHEAGFEEASRALFAGDQAGFDAHIASWPKDVQLHLKKILADAFWA